MSTTTAPPRQINTDVRRRTVLPTTLQNLAHLSASSANELPSNEYLDKIEEELNRKVDADMDMLVDGMAELVKLSQITGKDHYRVALDAFQAQNRTSNMIKSAHSLLALSHTLKLMHLFADTETEYKVKEQVQKALQEELDAAKAKVRELVANE